jgi:hypothetical protein
MPTGLTAEQHIILNKLLELRTATASQFEVKTNRIGQNIKPKLIS